MPRGDSGLTPERGSVTIAVLSLLLFLTMVVAAVSSLFLFSVRRQAVVDSRLEARDEITGIAKRIFTVMIEDETPWADSSFDELSAFVEEMTAPTGEWKEYEISVTELSSRVNPNTAERNLFEETGLDRLFIGGGSVDLLQSLRYDEGFSTDVAGHYGSILAIDDYPELFSGYGLFNVNVCDEIVLETVAFGRSGDREFARMLRNRLREARSRLELIDRESLPALLGPYEEELADLLVVAPLWNVHFLPEELLTAILSYPAFGVEEPRSKAELLIDLRSIREIAPEELEAIVGTTRSRRLYEYLGTRSWFLEVLVTRPTISGRFVFALDAAWGEEARSGTLIERSYSAGRQELQF